MSFISLKYPRSLYNLCLELFVSILKNLADPSETLKCKLVQKLAPSILEDILLLATWKEHAWSCDWSLLLTSSIRAVVVPCHSEVLQMLNSTCKALRQILFLPLTHPFDSNIINDLPKHVTSVDFNGEHFHRSRCLTNSLFLQSLTEGEPPSWLIEAESVLRQHAIGYKISNQNIFLSLQSTVSTNYPVRTLTFLKYFKNIVITSPSNASEVSQEVLLNTCCMEDVWLFPKSMLLLRQKIPDYILDDKHQFLVELHLSTVKVTLSDIQKLIKTFPKLKLLRHYQLTSALYEMHVEDWKQGLQLPLYKLRNLDADFSYIVRSQWAPRRVLPVDALQLAILLCPDAYKVKIRFDCSTNHDSISALLNLKRLKEISLVRVTDGERCLLDFTDITPLLEKHGSHLTVLELKVIEEVDTHIIAEACSRLEVLILSGCSYKFPEPTCETSCLILGARASRFFSRLQYFFYADGDDFSSDHSLPQCFWKCLLQSDKSDKHHYNKLRGLFVEAPRISEQSAQEIFRQKCPLPDLQVLSICRYTELLYEQLVSLISPELTYLKISQCDQFSIAHINKLKKVISNKNLLVFYEK